MDRIVAVGSPLKGAPSAFKSVFGGPALPHFNDLLGLIHGRNRLAFMRNLLSCLATFPSVYQLFPHRDIDFLRFEDGRQLNPLRDRAMEAEHQRLAELGHLQVRAGIQVAKANRLKLFSIFADYHEGERTDAYYEVAPMGQRQGYAILEVLDTPSGDGTVLADSAQGKGSFRGFPVRNASHAFLCNNDKVVDCLRSVL